MISTAQTGGLIVFPLRSTFLPQITDADYRFTRDKPDLGHSLLAYEAYFTRERAAQIDFRKINPPASSVRSPQGVKTEHDSAISRAIAGVPSTSGNSSSAYKRPRLFH